MIQSAARPAVSHRARAARNENGVVDDGERIFYWCANSAVQPSGGT